MNNIKKKTQNTAGLDVVTAAKKQQKGEQKVQEVRREVRDHKVVQFLWKYVKDNLAED